MAAALLFSILLLASSPSFAKDFDFGDVGGMGDAAKFMKYIPPFIKGVWHEPEKPAPGDDITVHAEIFRLNLTADSNEYVEEAFVEYSSDGGATWEEAEMYEEDDEPNTWSAEFPAPETPGEVAYRIRARDSAGNIVIEKPQPMEKSEEETPLPEMKLGLEFEDTDESGEPPPPDYLNLLSTAFDYDSDSYYFRLKYEAAPDKGTISPIDANVYIVAMINKFPEIDFTKFNLSKEYLDKIKHRVIRDMAGHVSAWFYAPIAEIAPPLPEIGKIPGVALVRLDEKNFKRPVFDTAGFAYEIGADSFNLRVDRNTMAGEPADVLMFVSFNIRAVGSDFTHVKAREGDVSNSAVVYFRSHAVEVE